MAWEHEHVKDCERILGEGFPEVHVFLDQYAKKYPPEKFGSYHRRFLHNNDGLSEIRKRWGNRALVAGIIHLDRDKRDLKTKEVYLKYLEGLNE